MVTLDLWFRRKFEKVSIEQYDDITVVQNDGANDGAAVLLKVKGDSTNDLTFGSNFQSLDGSTFDNTKMNHIYMIYDADGDGTDPKVFYSIKTTDLP